MSRRLLVVLVAVALVCTGCGPIGQLSPAEPSTPSPVDPSVTEVEESVTPAPTPTSPPEPTAPAPAAPAELPPSIPLPGFETTPTALPVQGIAAQPGETHQLWVQCAGPLVLWASGGATSFWDSPARFECEEPGVVQVEYDVTGAATEVVAVVEPDSQLPLIVRVPRTGMPPDEVLSRFADGFGDATALDITVHCSSNFYGQFTIGSSPLWCYADNETLQLTEPVGDPLPPSNASGHFNGFVSFAPKP